MIDFVALVLFSYGLFCVVSPESARRQYLKSFDVDVSTTWYKPRTYLNSRPPRIVFRLVGIVLVTMSIGLIYIKYSQ
jgi:hypothetical protein